jgi:predicted Zn-dependent peptidase
VDAEMTHAMNKRFVATVLVAVSLAVASSHAHNAVQRPGGSAATMTPVILKRQLSNGLRVWIAEQHELPVVQMRLLVPVGTDADPRGRYGVASLTSAMITEGAGARSAVEIADALDVLQANYVTAIQADGSGDVQRVAQQYVHPDHLTIVIVGDRKTIEPSIRALNLGSITNMNIDEVFAPAK